MTQKTAKTPNLQQIASSIEHKERLQKELEDVTKSTYSLSARIPSLEVKKRDAKMALESIQNTVNNSPEDQRYRNELNTRKSEYERIEAELKQKEQEMDGAQARINEINMELATLTIEVTQADIEEHMQLIADAESELNNYKGLINQQQELLAKGQRPIDSTGDLIQQREKVLVDIALGEDKTKQLAQLESEIERLQEQDQITRSANEKAAIHAEQTITGLQARANIVQGQLKSLNNLTPKLHDRILSNIQVQAVKTYEKVSREVVLAIKQVAAIDNLIAEIGYSNSAGSFPKEWWTLQLPKLGDMSGHNGINSDERFFVNTRNNQVVFEKEKEELKKILHEQGIHLN